MSYAQKLNTIRFQAFKKQNPKLGGLDVTFDFGDKKLYAQKFMLESISTTFASMISERWTTMNEPIPIETYSYDDFRRFLHFLYFGECKLSYDNIFSMVNIAEFYQVAVFKEYCDEYLTTYKFTLENVIQLLDVSMKYSLINLRKFLTPFVRSNLWNLLINHMPNDTLLEVLKMGQPFVDVGKIFKKVYEWAEHQAMMMKEDDPNVNLDDRIKEILGDFLPLFNFAKMDPCFVIEFVVAKSLLPSGPDLSAILSNSLRYCLKKVKVEVIDKNGKMMKGHFFDHDLENVYEELQKIQNLSCYESIKTRDYVYWATPRGTSRPIKEKLKKSFGIAWYLIYDSDNDFAVKNYTKIISTDYLIAEMFADNGFILNQNCKIRSFFV